MKEHYFFQRSTFLSGVLLAVAFLFAAPLSAQTPRISIQGTLKTSNGATVADGNYDVIFHLYNQETGGTPLWSDTTSVEVIGGIYNYYLGSNNKPLDPAHFVSTLYLGVKIGNYELVPRTELSYAPYAFSVTAAQTVVCSGAVGDVKYSILNPVDFVKENGDCWVPMDGRSLAGTKLATYTSSYNQANLPDGGGVFIRAQEFAGSSDNDPDRTTGSPIAALQNASYQLHDHGTIEDHYIQKIEIARENTNGAPNFDPVPLKSEFYTQPNNDFSSWGWVSAADGSDHGMRTQGGSNFRPTGSSGGSETRPKNLNFWIYIRIN